MNNLHIESYDGFSDPKKTFNYSLSSKNLSPCWNFNRLLNNYSYTRNSNISYRGECSNNLIISSGIDLSLNDISNAFIILSERNVDIGPISNHEKVIRQALEALKDIDIKYTPPESIHTRDNLLEISLETIAKTLRDSYGIEVRDINLVQAGNLFAQVYRISSRKGENYIFKYRGKDKKKSEILSDMSTKLSFRFPKSISRIDLDKYCVEVNGQLYGLESFVQGEPVKRDDSEYISSIGIHIAKMHEELQGYFKENPNTDLIFKSKGDYFSESNLLATYLDLIKSNLDHGFLTRTLATVMKSDISQNIRNLPDIFIHGDLNASNLFWANRELKVIDLETIRSSPLIEEFPPLLLLSGHGKEAEYLQRSVPGIIDSYNRGANKIIGEKEVELLQSLLLSATLRYYVISNIRKRLNSKTFLSKTNKSLINILEDFKI